MLVDQILEAKGRAVATVTPDATVAEAVAELATHNVGALVVSSDGRSVEGILSERDIVRGLSEGAEVLQRRVRDLMATDVSTCTGRSGVEELMTTMTTGRFRHLPVVADGELCGIISIGDVVKARIDELATEAQQLVGYIRDGR
ncbi:MAG TPA: histidine kinase [Acidimicrobiaceae bacterium]|nr:histidine kinase [Acidimicrobiaceae bacterium]